MDKANFDRPSRYDRWINDWQGRHDIVLPREAYAELHKALSSEPPLVSPTNPLRSGAAEGNGAEAEPELLQRAAKAVFAAANKTHLNAEAIERLWPLQHYAFWTGLAEAAIRAYGLAAPAQAPGELVELVKRLRWRASMGGDYGQHERKLDTDAAAAIAALTALSQELRGAVEKRLQHVHDLAAAARDRRATANGIPPDLQEIVEASRPQSVALAEMAEPGVIGAFAARDAAVARAEAAEAELARLQSAQPAGHRPESEEVVAVKPLEWRLRALHPHADRK